MAESQANPSLPSVPCHPMQALGDFRPLVAASSLDGTFRGGLRQVSAGLVLPATDLTPGLGIADGELRVAWTLAHAKTPLACV